MVDRYVTFLEVIRTWCRSSNGGPYEPWGHKVQNEKPELMITHCKTIIEQVGTGDPYNIKETTYESLSSPVTTVGFVLPQNHDIPWRVVAALTFPGLSQPGTSSPGASMFGVGSVLCLRGDAATTTTCWHRQPQLLMVQVGVGLWNIYKHEGWIINIYWN